MKTPIALLVLLLLVNCKGTGNRKTDKLLSYSINPLAVEFNNKGISVLDGIWPHQDSINNLLYDSALFYFNKAVSIDSLYILAHTNKADVLRRRGELHEALTVLNLVEKIDPSLAEAIMAQGFLLEKMDNYGLSQNKYKKALSVFENRLEEDPSFSKIKADIAFVYLFTEGKDRAMNEIENAILEAPESRDLIGMKNIIQSFDRKKFIAEY